MPVHSLSRNPGAPLSAAVGVLGGSVVVEPPVVTVRSSKVPPSFLLPNPILPLV